MEGSAIAAAITASQEALARRLLALDDEALLAPSRLPGWDRLTVVCHIRYGAGAIAAMVRAALRDEAALFYPGGRAEQRPGTLKPVEGEAACAVVESFVDACAQLDATLASVPGDGWTTMHREPDGHVDLGPQSVYQLAVLRLTEVDVHAVDLDIGIERWSDAFVASALPLRLQRLSKRLANSPSVAAPRPAGTWLLRARDDGAAHLVASTAKGIFTRPAVPDEAADGVIDASRRDLIALMLGRPFADEVVYSNDFAASFAASFPGP